MKKLLLIIALCLFFTALCFAFTYDWVIDQMEYANDGAAQTAYVTSDDGDGSTDFVDDGDTGHTVTAYGNAVIDTAQKKFGNASGIFPGAGTDKLTIPDHADFNFGSGNWSIDFWHRVPSGGIDTGGEVFYSQRVDGSNRLEIFQQNSKLWITIDGVENGTTDAQTWTAGTFYHLEFTRSGSTMYIFKGGTSLSLVSATAKDIQDLAADVWIGAATWGWPLEGHLDEFRISKGVARHTTGFTPETSEYSSDANTKLLLHCNAISSLQSYSESTIKQQGSYSLKVVAVQTDSLNDTLTKTLTNNLDLSNAEGIEYDIYALRTGSNIKISIHDSGGTTTEHTANVASSNTNQTESWDISGVSNVNKDDIDWVKVTIVNADSDNTFYLDDIKFGIDAVAGGGSWGFIE